MRAVQQQRALRSSSFASSSLPVVSSSARTAATTLTLCQQPRPRLISCAAAFTDDTPQTRAAPLADSVLAAQKEAQERQEAAAIIAERKQRRQREQLTYQVSAIAATAGVISLAVIATYLRFHWHLEDSEEIAWEEIVATLTLVAGGVFGMEMWARYAHKALWHDYQPGWALHKSHHEPRVGPFEANDIFAIINGVPAMALCAYGFLTPGVPGGVCFGAGLGITLFGIMYMFVHDGLVHRRFPVGPVAQLPYMKKIAVAHQLHHSEKYNGVPWGLFLGPQELEAIPGAKEDLERLAEQLDWSKR